MRIRRLCCTTRCCTWQLCWGLRQRRRRRLRGRRTGGLRIICANVVVMIVVVMMMVMVMMVNCNPTRVLHSVTFNGGMRLGQRGLRIGLHVLECVSFRNGCPAFSGRWLCFGCFGLHGLHHGERIRSGSRCRATSFFAGDRPCVHHVAGGGMLFQAMTVRGSHHDMLLRHLIHVSLKDRCHRHLTV